MVTLLESWQTDELFLFYQADVVSRLTNRREKVGRETNTHKERGRGTRLRHPDGLLLASLTNPAEFFISLRPQEGVDLKPALSAAHVRTYVGGARK